MVHRDIALHQNLLLVLIHCIMGTCNFSCFLSSADFFSFKINFLKKLFQEYHRNFKQFGTLARRIVGPDLGPNCLPWLSADDTW